MASWLRWKSSRLLIVRRKDQDFGLEFILAAFDTLFLSLRCHMHNDSPMKFFRIFVGWWMFFPTGAFRFMKLLQYTHSYGRVCIKPNQNENVGYSHHTGAFLPSFPLRKFSCSTSQPVGVVSSQRVDTLPRWSCSLNKIAIRKVGCGSARQN